MVIDDRLNYPYPIFNKPEWNDTELLRSHYEQIATLNKEIQRLNSLIYVDLTLMIDKYLNFKCKREAAVFLTNTIETEKVYGRWHNIDLLLDHLLKNQYYYNHGYRGLHVGILMNTYHGKENIKKRQDYFNRVKLSYKLPRGLS